MSWQSKTIAKKKKLSEPQTRALRVLADDEWKIGWKVGREQTVVSLERLGLIESRYAGRLEFEHRLTESGRERLAEI
jgi:hypothetical protein